MRALNRKLIRELWHQRGQLTALSLVVACGVAVVVMARTSYVSLVESRRAYYRDYRFGELFVSLRRAPETLRSALAGIPGVATVETRVVVPVTLDLAGVDQPATGLLVSVPERRQPMLNDLHLRRGRWLEPGRRDEALVSEAFATANDLEVGQSLGAVINGRLHRLRIVGIAISPEYIYEIGAGGLFPDPRFGVLWLGRETLGPAFEMTGAFNDAVFLLAEGASETDVIARVDALLSRYGGLGAYGRSDHVSARFINDEIGQVRVSGTVIPGIFLGIAAFLLHIVMGRLVATERQAIGALKAFGYEGRTIGWHYVKLAVAALLLGTVLGIGGGIWLARQVNAQYAEYYRFPAFLFHLDLGALALALGTTVVAALAGAAGAVRRVIRLPAAVAMQAAAPDRFRPGPLERIGVGTGLSLSARMAVRNLERHPLKTGLSVLGIALATSMLLVGRYLVDSIGHLGEVQFRHAQRENISVTFAEPRRAAVRYELERLPGVLRAETFRSVPARIVAGHRSRRIALLGLEPRSELRRLVTAQLELVPLPAEGVLLTAKLAEILEVGPGDTITVAVLEGRRPTRQVPVAGTVDEVLGISAYMEIGSLEHLLGEGNLVTGAWLRTDPNAAATLNDRLKRLPGVAGVASRDASLKSFTESLAESIGLITGVLIGFAGSLAVAIIYNTARIAFSERAREFASLRVLGFTRGEVARILLSEQAVMVVAGLVAGLAIGYGLSGVLSRLYEWELFRLPLVFSGATWVFTIGVVTAAALASGLLVRRRLNRLDLVTALKGRE